MISSKKLPGLVVWLLVLALAAAFVVPVTFGTDGGVTMAYEETLFGQELLSVDIVMSETEWNSLLENAVSETYQSATVVINNEKYANVGIRCKGNTSLSTVASMGSDRYSFRIKFDEYNTGENCDGLSMLVLNNLMGDNTYLKEYFTYDMFHYLEADASLFTMARVSVNGEPWGVYLALEAVDENMLLREYGSVGELYKPDSMDFGGGRDGGGMPDMGDFEMPDMGNFEMPEGFDMGNFEMTEGFDMGNFQMPEGMEFPAMGGGERPADDENASEANGETSGASKRSRGEMPDMGGFDFGGFGGMGGGSSLNYTDDALDSYSTIWNGAKTDTTDADHKRVVEALKNISEGNVEEYMDVDNVLRYMAVQTFVVNLDSLTGSMSHNYYLYEDDGKLNLLPWDYNLAFGGFQGGDASDLVNFPIDTPFTSSLENRQFFKALLENEEYLAQYHEYLRVLCEDYVGTVFPQTYAAMRLQLDELVDSDAADPSAFCTNAEYAEAAEMLKTVIEHRAESILGQLAGTIPSTHDGQEAEPETLIDASNLDTDVMGRQFGGGGGGFGGFGSRDETAQSDAAPADDADGETAPQSGTDADAQSGGFPNFGSGEMPTLPEGMEFPADMTAPPQNMSQFTATESNPADAADTHFSNDPAAQSPAANTDPSAAGEAGSFDRTRPGGQRQEGDRAQMGGFAGRTETNSASAGRNLAITGGALGLLAAAFVFAKLYHRRRFRSR